MLAKLPRHLPWLVPTLAGLMLLAAARMPGDPAGEMRLQEFAALPIVYQGRCKPIDTLARNSLLMLSNRQSYRDARDQARPAVQWLLELMSSQLSEHGRADQLRVFRIENDQVLNMLGLAERPGFRYALDEFKDRLGEIQQQADKAMALEAGQRDLVAEKILNLYRQLTLYFSLARLDEPHMVPPQAVGDEWMPFAEAARQDTGGARANPGARAVGQMLLAYTQGDVTAFNQALAGHQERLATEMPRQVSRARFEVFFNHFEPFYQCSVLYVIALLLVFCAWLGWSEALNRAAFRLLCVTLAVHLFTIVARMILQDRPLVMVTNLYSSAVFIGLVCVTLGLILERVMRNGLGLLVGAVAGALTQLIAHHLSGDGDTMEMMQAVLDTNFWLATHVTAITIGYAATFVSGLLGAVFIVRGVLTKSLDRESARRIAGMVYAIVCFATLFSFLGTVLGGIWADQSWGRFWGWDPKENGALIIVLWNALILHARWGGMVRERGLAILAVFGNVVTAWSWFGVNMLGVGLHSYGFMGSAVFWLIAFVFGHLVLMAIGLLPQSRWRSPLAGLPS